MRMRRPYYGWAVVAASVVIYTVIMGVTYSSYGLFVLPVSREFGLSRTNANTGIIILNLGIAALSPFLGRLIDRVSTKRVMVVSSLVFAAGFLVLAATHVLWVVVVVLALLLPLGFVGSGALTAPLLIARWFTRHRGRALAISQLGYSGGGLLLTPIVGVLIERLGWRPALLITGVGAGTVLLAIALALRERPRPSEHCDAPATSLATPEPSLAEAGRPLSVGATLRRAPFWTINIGCGLIASIGTALIITMPPLARAQGLSTMQAASVVSMMSAFGIVAMLLLGLVADRVNKLRLLSGLFAAGAVANAALAISHTYAMLLVASGALGLMIGATYPCNTPC